MSKASQLHLEEVSLNAWPAIRQFHIDGWLLRLSGGMTRRSNSVIALGKGFRELHTRIETCRAIYSSAGQKCYFRINSTSMPSDLDQVLADLDYSIEAPSLLLGASISTKVQINPAIEIHEIHQNDWLTAICRFRNWNNHQGSLFNRISLQIVGRVAQALVRQDDQIIAVGMGTLQEQYLSLMHIYVDPDWRGQGFARGITRELCRWAQKYQCKQALLTVEAANKTACKLYQELGFKELDKYHYRVKANN